MAEVATQVTVPILDMNLYMNTIKTEYNGKVGTSVTQITVTTIEENKENECHVEVRILSIKLQAPLKSHLSYAAFK